MNDAVCEVEYGGPASYLRFLKEAGQDHIPEPVQPRRVFFHSLYNLVQAKRLAWTLDTSLRLSSYETPETVEIASYRHMFGSAPILHCFYTKKHALILHKIQTIVEL